MRNPLHRKNQAHKVLGRLLKSGYTAQLAIILSRQVNYNTVPRFWKLLIAVWENMLVLLLIFLGFFCKIKAENGKGIRKEAKDGIV